MLNMMKTLITGASARTEERAKDVFALELIDQKIRETETELKAAKSTLATLMQRRKSETRQLDALTARLSDLTDRARAALKGDRADLAEEAARAIADMENEATLRRDTITRLDTQILRLRSSVESGHRRVIDLKQGATTAKAIRREQQIQSRLRTTISGTCAADEAQELISRVVKQNDPFEQSQILSEINASLDGSSISDRMADAGFGDHGKSTASDVLERLKSA